MRKIIALVVSLCPIIGWSQNVGIGTTDPTAKLHVVNSILDISQPVEDFHDGTFDPPYQTSTITGISDYTDSWTFSSVETYGGSNFSLKAPTAILYTGVYECISVPMPSIPNAKSYTVSLYYKSFSGFFYAMGNDDLVIDGYSGASPDWEVLQFSGVSDGTLTDVTFCLTGDPVEGFSFHDFYLGAIDLDYRENHALRVVDGTEAEGKVLVSDGAGNATWKTISDAGGSQELDFMDGDLSISGENTVEVHTLKNVYHRLKIHSDYNTVWGDNNIITGFASTGSGSGNISSGLGNFVSGAGNTIQGDFGSAFGSGNNIFNQNSMVWGAGNSATGISSTAWGGFNTSSGNGATTWGTGNTADNLNSTAWGDSNTSSGDNSTVWGVGNSVSGLRSTAWGMDNIVSGTSATAWGKDNTASGLRSTVWGDRNTASTLNATAWGEDNAADGIRSTVWGEDNTAYGSSSTVWGEDNYARSDMETSLGRYNYSSTSGAATNWVSTDQIFSIGIGADDTNRQNAVTILKNGKTAINKNVPEHIFEVEANETEDIIFKTTAGNIDVIIDGVDGNNSLDFRESGVYKGGIGWDVTNQRMFCYSGTNVWYVKDNNFGIKDDDPTYDLELPNSADGDARARNWYTYSDSRVKQNQTRLNYGLKEILRLEPKRYDHHQSSFESEEVVLDDNFNATIGLIAQEVHSIVPESVTVPEDESSDLWSMNYEKLIPILINAIQDLNREMVLMSEKLKMLQKENTQLSASLDKQ